MPLYVKRQWGEDTRPSMVSNCAGLVNIARDRLMDVSVSEMVGPVATSP
jgi:hypothetical protein